MDSYTSHRLHEWLSALKKALDKIQAADNPREIQFKHDPTGFGAQVSRRILALRIAFITGARATFVNENMFPYVLPFEPLAEKYAPTTDKFSHDPWNITEQVSSFDFWKFWDDAEIRKRVYTFLPLDCPLDGTQAELHLTGFLFDYQALNPRHISLVSDAKKRIGLPERYIAVHFRRGDKSVETPYIPASEYRASILAVAKESGIKDVYIASDSADAPQALGLSKHGLKEYFDTDEVRYNNANHKFLMANQHLAAQESNTAVKTIYILAGADRIVGQDNAHFAIIAAGHIANRNLGTPYGALLRGSMQLDRPIWRAWYTTKRGTRSLAKFLMPWLALKNRK